MFCCPYPRDSSLEPVQVPLIATAHYALGTETKFSDFTTVLFDRVKHVTTRIDAQTEEKDAAATSLVARAFASVIQSWVFFGLASEALGQDVKHEEFVTPSEDGSGEKFIDARIPEWYLEKLKARWEQLDQNLSAEKFDALKDVMKKKFESARLATVIMDIYCLELDDEDNIIAKVLLSVHILLYVVVQVLDRYKINIPRAVPALSLTTRFLKRRMIENGWCEKRLNMFESEPLFYPAMYFLSSFDPLRSRIEDHSRCDSSRCQVSSSLSDPIHRTAECLCDDIPVPIEHVNRIISAGGIPLVRVTWSDTGKTILEVVPYTPGTIYIAISHVWSDRQFGSSRNSLPKCQLKYLEEVISIVPTDMDQWGLANWLINWQKTTPLTGEIEPPSRTYQYFWLDSFCIPQAPEHANLRSQAIESMNLIYAAARHTLVFDKALRSSQWRTPTWLSGSRWTAYLLCPFG
ncbi:hypothetical protein VTL71DRAFT_6360 [Oculimacula yallundae]|uniref:Heterokaryon incompatibility domain-containing protein n=1 Tax=Oculimacula yallundae TaxID=86028 RepID=A0ABR4BWQ9_9HELO